VFGDYPGYESPASGKWIEGRKARAEDFARTGTRPYEDGEREMAQLRRVQEERKLDNHVDEVVERTAAALGV
jgi:chorismate mutase